MSRNLTPLQAGVISAGCMFLLFAVFTAMVCWQGKESIHLGGIAAGIGVAAGFGLMVALGTPYLDRARQASKDRPPTPWAVKVFGSAVMVAVLGLLALTLISNSTDRRSYAPPAAVPQLPNVQEILAASAENLTKELGQRFAGGPTQHSGVSADHNLEVVNEMAEDVVLVVLGSSRQEFHIPAGNSQSLAISDGTVRLQWMGMQTQACKEGDPLEFRPDHGWRVVLKPVVGGNYHSHPVSKDQFGR